MDIFDQVKKMPYADYLDMHTGYIYHIHEYTKLKELGLPVDGIKVSYNGKLIGVVREKSSSSN